MSFQRRGGRSQDPASRSTEAAPIAVGKRSLTEMLPVQRSATSAVPAGPGPQVVSPAAPTRGHELESAARTKMEAAFGVDFSSVRVHEGPQAGALGAAAYAQGNDIHFAPGRYDPHSEDGQQLIGHELTHVVQQRAGRVETPQGKGAPINADPALEAQADALGAQAARGESVAAALGGSSATSRTGVVQCMKIVDIGDAEETVAFDSHEELPDDGGDYLNDGYRYQFVKDEGGKKLYRRQRKQSASEQQQATRDGELSDLIGDLEAEHRANGSVADGRIRELADGNPKRLSILQQRAQELRCESDPGYQTLAKHLAADPTLSAAKLREIATSATIRAEVTEYFIDQHFTHAVRFSSPEDMKAKATPAQPWHEVNTPESGKFPNEVLSRAAGHMAGSNAKDKDKGDSPFVSLALSEGALLKNGDGWVSGIMYGSDTHAKAPDLSRLRVPNRSIIGPQNVTGHLESLDLDRSRRETEALYYGQGLDQYVEQTQPNPYGPADRDKFHGIEELKRAEEVDDTSIPSASTGASEGKLLDLPLSNVKKLVEHAEDLSRCRAVLAALLEVEQLAASNSRIENCKTALGGKYASATPTRNNIRLIDTEVQKVAMVTSHSALTGWMELMARYR